jgi:hypothetical protein
MQEIFLGRIRCVYSGEMHGGVCKLT